MGNARTLEALVYERGSLKLLDQRKLPLEEEYVDCNTAQVRPLSQLDAAGGYTPFPPGAAPRDPIYPRSAGRRAVPPGGRARAAITPGGRVAPSRASPGPCRGVG